MVSSATTEGVSEFFAKAQNALLLGKPSVMSIKEARRLFLENMPCRSLVFYFIYYSFDHPNISHR